MAEFINFEAEEEGDDIDNDNDNSDNDDDADDLAEFIDDKVIPYQDVPPNPYLERSLQLPRGLQKVIRVSCLI